MADKKNYYIPVEGKLIEVEEPVYIEYYRMSRRERYLEERDMENGVMSYDALDNNGLVGQEMFKDTRVGTLEDMALAKELLEQLHRCIGMLPKAEQDLIHAKILVKSISRFARNTTECLESIRELKALGISIFFEEHNIDTKMVSSEMLTAVLASCAQTESESISRNMRWSIQKRMENGTFNTCRAAIGFRLSEDGLQVHPEEASVVYRIFEDYLQGMNTREIASRLNQEQALDREWSRRLVDYILMNERYAGNALLQKKYRTETMPRIKKPNRGERPMYYVRNSNPAIVSQEMFEQAGELRKSRRSGVSEASGRPLARTVADIQRGKSTKHIRPRFGVWENVPGAFSSGDPKGEDFRIVLEEFLRIGFDSIYVPRPYTGCWESAGRILLGDTFSLAWRVLDTQYWPGTPQRRRRIYLVVDFGGTTAPTILFDQESLPRDFTPCIRAGKAFTGTA